MPSDNIYTRALTSAEQERLIQLLTSGNFKPVSVPHTRIAVEADKCRVNLYNSGKCMIQGKGTRDFILFHLEPEVLLAAGLGYEDVTAEPVTPHMGIDESGKGDYFGPLVACAAYVDAALADQLRKADVRDCKTLSDKQVLAIGEQIRNILGKERFAVVMINPVKYNELYTKIRNVNSILAWAHARCIEDLLEKVPDCPRALADQFANPKVVERALMKKGRQIKLEQRTKAESDIAVAAASVIARECFLRQLARLGEPLQTKLPKGASDLVRNAAINLVREKGADTLLSAAKCHFKTTDAVLAECGLTRAAIGPDGQATSSSYGNLHR